MRQWMRSGGSVPLVLVAFVFFLSSQLVCIFSFTLRYPWKTATHSSIHLLMSATATEYKQQLKIVSPSDIQAMRFDPVDPTARDQASVILKEVREKRLDGLLEQATKLGDIPSKESKYMYNQADLEEAFKSLDSEQQVGRKLILMLASSSIDSVNFLRFTLLSLMQGVLTRTADRIKNFADAQRKALEDMTMAIPGGEAGHTVAPVNAAGCYAPGGRYPLPSSVLMTALTARAAGVPQVWVASPRPAVATLAAAHVARADGLIAIGGAQAIGAMAYGVGIPACDVIVGPGNKWVTAAKSLVSGICGIDMLAGPSEVLVIADKTADADIVAADLLAQAEHDPEARPILISTDAALVERFLSFYLSLKSSSLLSIFVCI